jgi:hypothetical protein
LLVVMQRLSYTPVVHAYSPSSASPPFWPGWMDGQASGFGRNQLGGPEDNREGPGNIAHWYWIQRYRALMSTSGTYSTLHLPYSTVYPEGSSPSSQKNATELFKSWILPRLSYPIYLTLLPIWFWLSQSPKCITCRQK